MAEKQELYGFVTRLPKDNNELSWRTTGYQGYNIEGTYQYQFSDNDGWRQPVFTKLDVDFFKSKPDEYRYENAQGRESRPQRPVREEVKPVVEAPKPEPVVAKSETVQPKTELASMPKRMGRLPKSESQGV